MPRDAASIPGDLIALRSNVQITQPEDPSKLPTRLVVLPWGEHKTAKGSFQVNDVTLSAMPKNQELTNFDRVCLDFDHNTVPGQPAYKGEPTKIAAYARPVCLAGEGIVYEDIEWTPEGREYVSGGHYRDLSPAVKTDTAGNVIFLHSAAVCRQGAVPDLILFSAHHLPATQTPPKTKHMDPKALLCAILGLDPEKATDEEITAAAHAAADSLKKPEDKTDAKPEVDALTARVDALSADVAKVLEASTSHDRANIIALASSQGKVIPAPALKLGNEDLKALVADLPVTVPLEKRTPSGSTEALSASSELQSAEAEVIKGLGISEDAFKKHNAAK